MAIGHDRRLELRIEELVLDVPGAPGAAETVGRELLEQAFQLLASRLERSPLARQGDLPEVLRIERLQVDSLPLERLVGVRGAEDLADALYAQLVRRSA
jgi:hypothetical protein